MIFGATLLRHAEMRKSMKKAEFSEGGTRITWIGALVNLFLAFFKLFAGVAGRSAAMVADAGHSFSDLFSDGLTLLALRMSVLPPDVDHPYGHGRFESVASLAIGTFLARAPRWRGRDAGPPPAGRIAPRSHRAVGPRSRRLSQRSCSSARPIRSASGSILPS